MLSQRNRRSPVSRTPSIAEQRGRNASHRGKQAHHQRHCRKRQPLPQHPVWSSPDGQDQKESQNITGHAVHRTGSNIRSKLLNNQ